MSTEQLGQLERRAQRAIAECREEFALTDATHSRSTSRRKSGAQRARERAYAEGLCEGVCAFSDDLTPTAAWDRLEGR
jgi:hypothetical protein